MLLFSCLCQNLNEDIEEDDDFVGLRSLCALGIYGD